MRETWELAQTRVVDPARLRVHDGTLTGVLLPDAIPVDRAPRSPRGAEMTVRLLPDATSANLGDALEARVHDGLLLIGRQWQFGEHVGDDTGTPASVELELEQAPLGAFRPGRGEPVAYDPRTGPLHPLVESETLDPLGERAYGLRIEAPSSSCGCSTLTVRRIAVAPTGRPTDGRSRRPTWSRSTRTAARGCLSSQAACAIPWRSPPTSQRRSARPAAIRASCRTVPSCRLPNMRPRCAPHPGAGTRPNSDAQLLGPRLRRSK